MPSSLRKALHELPTTLDDTYERALQGIPKEQWQQAHRLFQCLVAGIRPLRFEELAEMFARELDSNAVPNLVEGWRPENPKVTVLSACSSLIVAIEDDGSRFFHVSHFSVKEFLTSEVGNIRHYHISLDDAHVTIGRACLAVLLKLDERADKKRFPFAFYAPRHWVDHAEFGDITTPQIQVAMERLFDPSKQDLASWTGT